jgi:hypothetical protein
MPVSEGLALAGLDDQVVDASLLRTEISTREARLLAVGQPVLERRVLDLPQILLRVAHGRGA